MPLLIAAGLILFTAYLVDAYRTIPYIFGFRKRRKQDEKRNSNSDHCYFLQFFWLLHHFEPVFSPRTFSEAENRVLAQFPELAGSGFSLMITQRSWRNGSRISLLPGILDWCQSGGERALGKIENQNVFFGREDWLSARWMFWTGHKVRRTLPRSTPLPRSRKFRSVSCWYRPRR